MKALSATVAIVFAISFLAGPTMGAGWFWDVGNALGFAGFAGLLFLTITGSRRVDVLAHRLLANAVFALVVAHALWFLLGDATVVTFIEPGAPDYMWLGIVSLVLIAFMMIAATLPDRRRLHSNYRSFRYWHRVLTVAAILTGAYHVMASGFYLHTWHQLIVFGLLSIAVCSGHEYWSRLGRIDIPSPAAFAGICTAAIAAFAVLRNLPS